MMGVMTLMAVPEWETAPLIAQVYRLQDLRRPSDDEIAAKKAKRRLERVEQVEDLNGVIRPRYLNADGFDAWGKDVCGHYDPAQDVTKKNTDEQIKD